MRLEVVGRQSREMVVWCTPTSFAIRRVLQCVPDGGGVSMVLRTISASNAAEICFGRPERGRSRSMAASPSAS